MSALEEDGLFYKLTDIPMSTEASCSHKGSTISFAAGDIYFVLDFTWTRRILERLLPYKNNSLITTGVMYYDLIPITHPEICSNNKDAFSEWVLETAKYSDYFACISKATKETLKRETAKLYPRRKISDDIAFSFKLGADISTYDTKYTPIDNSLLRAFNGNSTYLIVSTIEPRKNHAMMLNAFDQIWKSFPKAKLCFIGKEGWMIEEVVKRIRSHPMLNSRLFWLEGVNDKDVQWAYRNAKCVLYPSFDEGFGLPIIEALHCGTPVIASDIPVFHEVAGDRIGYLNPYDPMTLVKWVERIEQSGVPKEIIPDGNFKWATWKESTKELLDKMFYATSIAREMFAAKLKRQAFEQRVAIEIVKMKNKLSGEDSLAGIIPREENTQPHQKEAEQAPEQKPATDIIPSEICLHPYSNHQHIEALPIKKLLSMNGRDLIRHAYIRLLHRLPDPEGENTYYEKLLQGFPPISLISALRFSPEGRRVAEPVKHAFILHWLGRLLGSQKLIGKVARYIASLRFLSATRSMSRVAIIQLQEQEAHLAKQQKRITELEVLLQNQVAYNNNIQHKLIMLEKQAEQVTIIKQSLQAQTDRSSALEQSIQKQEDHINNVKQAIQEQTERSNAIEQSIQAQTDRSSALEQSIKSHENNISAAMQELKELSEYFNALEQSIKSQEDHINNVKQALQEQSEHSNTIEQSLQTQADRSSALEQSIQSHENSISAAMQVLKEQSERSNTVEQSLKSQTDRSSVLEQSVQKQEDHINNVKQVTQEQSDRLSVIEQSLQTQADRSSSLEATNQFPSLPFSNYSESEPYLKRAEKHVGKKAPSNINEKKEKFYTYFSEIWGDGNAEVQQQHYESYLPYLPRNSKYQFLDIGCGAGEFLGYMQWHGIKTLGIDMEESEVARCIERGLIVQQADAIDFLKKHDGLFSGISLLQVIEHIPQEQHIELLSLAKEKLSGDGVLIIETINPAHPLGFSIFFTDPTHLRPISLDYLAFIAQWCGFKNVGIINLYPVPVLPRSITNPKLHYHNYAIVARKR